MAASPAQRRSWSSHSFVAGSIAGASGTLVGHPLDTLKVLAQTGSGRAPSIASLFRGAATPVLTAGAVNSINLGIYENARRALCPEPAEAAPLWTHAVAGMAGGLVITVATAPLSRVKVHQQLTGQGFVATVRSIDSLRSLYTGVGMTALMESSRGFYMVVYSLFKRELAPKGHERGELPLWVRTLAGASANVVSWGVMYPIDVVRNVQQARAAVEPGKVPADALTCARNLLSQGGVGRLYNGYTWTMLRAGPVAGILMPCFEVVLPWLEARL